VPSTSEGEACPRCSTPSIVAARYCHRCGDDLVDNRPVGRRLRRDSFAAHPDEPVRSFNIVSSLLPLSSGKSVQTYRTALLVAAAIPLIAAMFGLISFALAAAALAVPAVFAVYLYDVNEWEDQPVPVTLLTFFTSGLLGVGGTLLVREVLLEDNALLRISSPHIDWGNIFLLGVISPLIAIVLSLIGPLVLASRPRFDDMIDGLTFGAIAGAAYAAAETLVTHRDIFTLGNDLHRRDAALWVAIVANAGVVKPLLYGVAIAIAGAGFSGIGNGYEGFRSRFWRSLGVAAIGMVAYGVGVNLFAEIDGTAGAALGLGWGALVVAVMIVLLRSQLHLGLLEAALESARNATEGKGMAHGAATCGECQMVLIESALFCPACGASVRATSKTLRRENSDPQANPLSTSGAQR
jgi:hypothetical protein